MSGRIYRNARPAKDTKRTLTFSVIIPAAGEGSRIKSFGSRSLVPVNEGTLLDRQVTLVRDSFPNNQIVLVTGFDAQKVMNKAPKGVICIENERYLETNVLRSIGIGLRASIHDHVIIIYGDLIFNKELLDFPINQSCIIHSKDNQIVDNEVGCIIDKDNNLLENMFYDLPNRWASIVYLTGKELKLFKDIAFNKQKEKQYTWEAINEVVGLGGKFLACSPQGGTYFDIDTSKDIENAKRVGF